MAKDKKKKEKKKKGKKGKKGKKQQSESSDTFSQAVTQKKEVKRKTGGLTEGVSLGQAVDRSGDRLYVGTDYREVYSWQYDRSWADILSQTEYWTHLPFTIGIEQELIIADDEGKYPPGEEMVFRMKEIVNDAINMLKEVLYRGRDDFLPVPD